MRTYTVHVPDTVADPLARGERTVFLREGFSLGAFVFGLFYLLRHRLWAAAAVWIVLLAVLAAFAWVIHPPLACLVALLGLMHLYLGTEGPDLARWGLGRRGYAMRDLVSASSLEGAEALFFARQPDTWAATPAARRDARWMSPTGEPAVIGVFPGGDAA